MSLYRLIIMKSSSLTADNTKDKLFVCSYPSCAKKFKTKFSMSRHYLVHSQEKNYACRYCGKRFALYQYLKEHTNTHTSEKPYVCGVAGCEERFSQTGKLSLHRRTHPEYKLKKYHPNSEYNKTKQRKPKSNNIVQVPLPKKIVKKCAEVPKEEPPKKIEPKIIEECNKPPSIFFGRNHDSNALHTTATKEPVEIDLTIPFNLNDPYVRYLTFLPYSSTSTLRPVLPLPGKKGETRIELGHYIPINLFQLTGKYAN